MKLSGVVKEGVRVYDNPKAAARVLERLAGRRFDEEIEGAVPVRRGRHNRWYFQVLVKAAQQWVRQKHGKIMSKESVHDMLARAFYGTQPSPLGGDIRKETHLATTEEFHAYCMEVETWLVVDEGWQLPAEEGEWGPTMKMRA